jgi:nucleotide-binding universal stress UspA family protein
MAARARLGEACGMQGPVICGIDDSSSAVCAIRVARDLAERYALPLVYVHVVDRRGSDLRAAETLREAQVGGRLVVEPAQHAGDRLVELAHERLASFLVLGTHGPRSSLLGSVSADVSRRASCPVLVVPPTSREESGQ